ncbi:MAG: glutaredoxin family protein [Aquabacterium sp.]|nr:glutaredoxin family protein [Aquabacterium sp.]
MGRERWRAVAGLAVVVALASGASQWWRSHLAGSIGAQLVAQVRPGDIQMLSSTTCVYCTVARRWLTDQQVPFTECFVERDAGCAARYQALGARGTPTLVVRGHLQLGFSPQQVLDGLQRGG